MWQRAVCRLWACPGTAAPASLRFGGRRGPEFALVKEVPAHRHKRFRGHLQRRSARRCVCRRSLRLAAVFALLSFFLSLSIRTVEGCGTVQSVVFGRVLVLLRWRAFVLEEDAVQSSSRPPSV